MTRRIGLYGESNRKRYTGEFKAKVVWEAIKDELTLGELAAKHGIHLKNCGPKGSYQVLLGRSETAGLKREAAVRPAFD